MMIKVILYLAMLEIFYRMAMPFIAKLLGKEAMDVSASYVSKTKGIDLLNRMAEWKRRLKPTLRQNKSNRAKKND